MSPIGEHPCVPLARTLCARHLTSNRSALPRQAWGSTVSVNGSLCAKLSRLASFKCTNSRGVLRARNTSALGAARGVIVTNDAGPCCISCASLRPISRFGEIFAMQSARSSMPVTRKAGPGPNDQRFRRQRHDVWMCPCTAASRHRRHNCNIAFVAVLRSRACGNRRRRATHRYSASSLAVPAMPLDSKRKSRRCDYFTL